MKKEYIVKKAEEPVNEVVWAQVQGISIDCYPWDENGYRPDAKAFACYTENALYIRFIAFEQRIAIKHFNYCEDVYKDSCVEFFFRPVPERDVRYMNFEMNAIGVLLLGFGENRDDWRLLDEVDPEIFGIRTSLKRSELNDYCGPYWTAEYYIPFSFLEKYYGKLDVKPGMRIEANFYKCGDETGYPHFGCWNPIDVGEPDFHRPEFFGNLILG